ncbi:hypothetical protein FK85_25840 [Halorubrum saccharovorum]|uniref:Uncharacterized protein n=1 Tax=Halorubrum saccharovorum TaxID=2248 RepID=A0A0F8CLM0_9EURY|nr:hypothetical protein FK85_25840 [Halorubrum saccharovorum]
MVAVVVLVVPPIVLTEATTRTYALTAAILILALGSAFPYAALVALGTLPLCYAGVASFAAPRPAADEPHPFSVWAALRHAVAGLAYVSGSAAVGAVGMGAQIGLSSDLSAMPAGFRPSFLHLGGVFVAGVFVSLQLWRYETPLGELAPRTVLGTVALGVLIALSPGVAFWVFNGF